MTDKIMACITNPVKCKLLLEIYSQEQTTAKHLADVLSDIPQATLYRNLKKMLNDGILKVVEETQVRGTVERTYALAFDLNRDCIGFVSIHILRLRPAYSLKSRQLPFDLHRDLRAMQSSGQHNP